MKITTYVKYVTDFFYFYIINHHNIQPIMKKIIFLLTIGFLLLLSCSSDNNGNNNEPLVVDEIRPPYNIKYEVQFSSNQTITGNTRIQYSHESNGIFCHWSAPTAGLDYLTDIELNTVWSHSFLVTLDTNPFTCGIKTNFNPISNTIVYFKIYVNNILVKDTPINVSPNNNPSVDFLNGISYAVY